MSGVPCSGVVVLVEDDDDTRELLATVLRRQGYEVAMAQDGVEAMDVLSRTEPVCFVLVDLFMPRMDGFAVLNAMKSDVKLAALPVCVSTSAPDLAPDGVPCLPKPIDLSCLFEMIERHCGVPKPVLAP
jgi:CheY-like chemotaxis protein